MTRVKQKGEMKPAAAKKKEAKPEAKPLKQLKKQNTPKKYPNKGTGEGKNPRTKCPVCGKYMAKLKYEFRVQGVSHTIKPVLICKCEHVEIDKEELAKLPE